jgi:hypothetical protein
MRFQHTNQSWRNLSVRRASSELMSFICLVLEFAERSCEVIINKDNKVRMQNFISLIYARGDGKQSQT